MTASELRIRRALVTDAPLVEQMLLEATAWIDALGVVMWETGELTSDRILAETLAGQFFVAEQNGEPAGTIRFQLEDPLFWPDIPVGESAFVHRLVVRRRFKGQGVSTALLRWAADRTHAMGRRHLRLDCDADRPKVRQVYEDFGFQLHSYRHVGPYYVARYEFPLG